MDTQIADDCFLEDINNILSSGEVPNLYKPDEFEEVGLCKGGESSVKGGQGISSAQQSMFP